MLSVIRKQQGLTLTEIIVVIGMLAIVTLLLVPNYQSYLAQNRVKGAAESLYSHFILARTTAISSSQNVTVTFTQLILGATAFPVAQPAALVRAHPL